MIKGMGGSIPFLFEFGLWLIRNIADHIADFNKNHSAFICFSNS